MKTINPASTSRTLASVLLALSAIVPLTVSRDAESAALSVASIIHETVNFTDPQCGYIPGGDIAPGGTITGTGISSLLGSVSISAHDCITFFPNPFSPEYFSFVGKMTFDTSSGSIFADYEGLFTPTSYPSIFMFTSSSFTITGGTGSFKKAEGSGTFLGGENIATGNGLLLVTGTISGYSKLKPSGFHLSSLTTTLDGSFDAAAIANLDPVPLANVTTLGQYPVINQDSQLLAETPLPEPALLALLGAGLASFALARRRKPFIRPAV